MAQPEQDTALAGLLLETGLVNAAQLQGARHIQATTMHRGRMLSLGESLVRAGIITASQRDHLEKKIKGGGSVTPPPTAKRPRIGAYELLNKLGEGGMGTVYLARDINADRLVALKVLLPEFTRKPDLLERFRHEAQSTGRLNHANIVSANCFGEDQGYYYYTMEYCEGETLDGILRRSGALPIDHVYECLIQIAEGLRYAHAHGCIHRDIKPANIMISKAGEVKILDLGLSKDATTDDSQNTAAGIALGTPHYIAPEQARGDPNIDGRCDIYALGGTFYHLITGQTPFDGPTAAVIMTKHLTEAPRNPRGIREEIPDTCVQVIRKMMAKQPADRYANMDMVLEDLRSLKAGRIPKHAQPQESSFLTETRVANRTKFMRNSEKRMPHGPSGPATRAVAAATRTAPISQSTGLMRALATDAHARPPASRMVPTHPDSPARGPGTRMIPTHAAHGPTLHIPSVPGHETPEPFIQAMSRPIPGLQTPMPPRRNGSGSEAGSRMGIATLPRRSHGTERPASGTHATVTKMHSFKLFFVGVALGLLGLALWINLKSPKTEVVAQPVPTVTVSPVVAPVESSSVQNPSAQAVVLPAKVESNQPQESPRESFARRKLKEILDMQKNHAKSDEIKTRLDDLVKNYGTTQAGKEAATMLNTYGVATQGQSR